MEIGSSKYIYAVFTIYMNFIFTFLFSIAVDFSGIHNFVQLFVVSNILPAPYSI